MQLIWTNELCTSQSSPSVNDSAAHATLLGWVPLDGTAVAFDRRQARTSTRPTKRYPEPVDLQEMINLAQMLTTKLTLSQIFHGNVAARLLSLEPLRRSADALLLTGQHYFNAFVCIPTFGNELLKCLSCILINPINSATELLCNAFDSRCITTPSASLQCSSILNGQTFDCFREPRFFPYRRTIHLTHVRTIELSAINSRQIKLLTLRHYLETTSEKQWKSRQEQRPSCSH